ncbi:snaclec CHH-B subunit beta-like isoform X2 [Solea solea]|uniref:snaclec CHH-B subunit beta-like isoform X2 n=1 Tax=Solea solea TaxID=90069 RepID=UPI00272BAC1E|nr:snaclec CHH-B subunit beta-like isoform X2 [Solea solea]
MRPVVVTAVLLLLVRMFMNVSEAGHSGGNRLNIEYCLKKLQTKETFDDAEMICQKEGGHLISFRDETALSSLTCPFLFNHWVGARRQVNSEGVKGEFQWIDGSGTFNLSYTDNQEDCMERAGWNILRTIPCSEKRLFLCQKAG